VFPHEYQRALRVLEEKKQQLARQPSVEHPVPPSPTLIRAGSSVHELAPIRDIEDAGGADPERRSKKQDRVLDKTRSVLQNSNILENNLFTFR
jgi:hypothetical protein